MSGTVVPQNPTFKAQAQRRSLSVRLPFLLAAIVLGIEFVAALFVRRIWASAHGVTASWVVFVGCMLLFSQPRSLSPVLLPRPVRLPFAVLHGVVLALAAALYIYAAHRPVSLAGAALPALVPLWWCVVVLLGFSGVSAFFSLQNLWHTLRAHGLQVLASFTAALVCPYAKNFLLDAWAHQSRLGYLLQAATFHCVQWVLGRFYPGVVCDPRTVTISTPHFEATVGYSCSGIEGLALTLTLSLVWLFLLRRELILRRAVWLVPIALLAIWTLNILRITALFAIGNSGHPDMAVRGFHSQAGWISFNLVGFGILVAAQRLPFLRRRSSTQARAHESASGTNPAAALLMPFLAVLAASMLTQAFSSGFERLYPLRCFAALLFLWLYRDYYRKLDWRTGWIGPVYGIGVIVLWIAYAHLPIAHFDGRSEIPVALAQLSPPERTFWIASRVFSAVIVIPIAEELAFRGYLTRVLVCADVENVPFKTVTLRAVLISSVLFGLMHGRLWPVGMLAGVLFALAARRANRIGDAVAAHATANLLLAIWVLCTGEYALW